MKDKSIRGQVEMNYGADNFCYILSRNGKRVDLTEWMMEFDGKNININIEVINK